MGLQFLEALPRYFGGKRKLLGEIFRDLPRPEDHDRELVFADAFMGGGSVSLFAKARGYRVLCNDIAERSITVGKGLIENDHVQLTKADLLRLFTEPPEPSTFCVDHLSPDIALAEHAAALDRVMAWARATPGTKGWMLRLLAVRYLINHRPMGNFGAKTILRQVADGDWDEVNGHYIKHCVDHMAAVHPYEMMKRQAEAINKGVFGNGLKHACTQGDVLDFLRDLGPVDVAFFDAPYGGTLDYAKSLRPLDEMLAGEPIPNPEGSRFSKADSLAWLEEVFAAAAHIPVWGITYGGPTTDLQELADLVGKYRSRVQARAKGYAHLAALASDTNKAKNVELLLTGWK